MGGVRSSKESRVRQLKDEGEICTGKGGLGGGKEG